MFLAMMPSAMSWNTCPLMAPPEAGRPALCMQTMQEYLGFILSPVSGSLPEGKNPQKESR